MSTSDPNPPFKPATSVVGEVQYTASSASAVPSLRADIAPLRNAVIVSSSSLAAMGSSDRAHAAGIAGLPLSTVNDLVAKGLPLVLKEAPNRDAAKREVQRLGTTDLAAEVGGPGSALPLVGIIGLVLISAASGLVTLLTLALGFGLLLALLGVVTTATPLVLAVPLGMLWTKRRGEFKRMQTSWQRVALARQWTEGDSPIASCLQKISELRQQIGLVDLPVGAGVDLLDGLNRVEERLVGLARAGDTPTEAEVTKMHSVMDDVAATLKRVSDSPEEKADEAMRDLLRATALTRGVVEDVSIDPQGSGARRDLA